MAVIQLMAAVISVWCLEYAGFSLTEYILVTLFIGIILLGAVMFYIRINMVPVFYFLVFILYPITIIQAMHISGSLDKIYDYESFSGTVDNIAYKNDYVMLYLKSNSFNAMGIVVYANSKAADNICVDDELIVYGTVKRFERERNPGNFNSYMYYTSGGYPYKCNADNIELVKGNSDSLRAQLYRLKQRIKNVYRMVFDEKACQLMNSMVLGDKYELDGDIKEMYQKSGMSHLLAISGVKTLKLDIPLVLETRINWGFVPLHIAIIYILKLCLGEEIIPRCRFPCSRGYLIKCINWQKKQSFSVSQSYRKS